MWWNSSSCFFVETKRDKPSALQELMADEHVFWVMRLRHTANFNWRQCSCSFPTSCNNDNGILTTLTAAGTVFNKCPKLVFSNFFSHHFGTPHLRTQNTPKILKDKSPYVIKIWYALLFSSWRKEARNGWGHLWPNGWSTQSRNSPRTPNPSIHQMETRWNLWQQTIRPRILLKILSKETLNTLQVSRLRTHHFVQIQFIQTPSNQRLYEKQMPMLKGALRHLTARFVQRVFQSKIFSITNIFIEKVFMLKSNPNPRNSNRQPIPKTT